MTTLDFSEGGISNKDKGNSDNPWSNDDVKVRLWLDVAITEVESDAKHLQCGQEEHCRWDEEEIPDLAAMDGNIDVRKA